MVLTKLNSSKHFPFFYSPKELITAQEKTNVLHKRLETMLNEVMDSVNTDQTAARLAELNARKDALTTDMDQLEKEIKEWEDSFREANEGRDPTDDERYAGDLFF